MKKMNMIIGGVILGAAAVWMLSSCKTIPKGARAVQPFDSKRYLGTWYEVARMDFRHEKNMSNVTANYSLNEDGTIKVVNRGYDYVKNEWEESVGKAKFVNSENEGMLKVSFFGPFYAGYNVIDIDPEYKYALVIGKNTDYMWLLSREKTMPDNFRKKYLEKARSLGFDVADLTWTSQE